MKKALIIATIADFIASFELNDINLLRLSGYNIYCAADYKSLFDQAKKKKLSEAGVIPVQIDFVRSPFSKKNIRAYQQLKETFDSNHFDLVHCHTPVGGVLGRFLARKHRKYGTKVFYTVHGFHFFKGAPLKNWVLFYPIEWVFSFWTDELITINKEDFARAKRMHAKHVTYIPGVGVDLKKFSPNMLDNEGKKNKLKKLGIPGDKFILLSVGELQERKNHIVVLNALCEMKNSNLIYLIVGTGKLRDQYQEIIDKNGMSGSIKLLGYRTDIAELCAVADCFVHPSIREGLGIAPLEAMACGLPLIAADINGIKDYTEDGVTGCCVDPRSVEEMKKAILKMYEDQDFRYRCGENNVQVVKAFDINNTSSVMKHLYKEVCND